MQMDMSCSWVSLGFPLRFYPGGVSCKNHEIKKCGVRIPGSRRAASSRGLSATKKAATAGQSSGRAAELLSTQPQLPPQTTQPPALPPQNPGTWEEVAVTIWRASGEIWGCLSFLRVGNREKGLLR